MWISVKNNWGARFSDLDKFIAERIMQRVDYNELISNQHRTINGYIQIQELIQLCELSLLRSKTVRTLQILLEEACSPHIKQNVVNDVIINKYFTDIAEFVSNYKSKDLLLPSSHLANQTEINSLKHKLLIFSNQLEENYFKLLSKELVSFDTKNKVKEFERRADEISTLIDLLISFLVFEGYSISSIFETLSKWLYKKQKPSAKKILQAFDLEKDRFNIMLYLGPKSEEVEDFVSILKTIHDGDVFTLTGKQLKEDFTKKYNIGESELVAVYVTSTIDPHSHVRNNYDELIKKVVIQKERKSLGSFNEFFERSYWAHESGDPNHFRPINLQGDPINVGDRKSTLRRTLELASADFKFPFDSNTNIEIQNHDQLNNAIFYYNLALGSKSIENSLSLLWTSLETILPYRVKTSDIESVQHFVETSLSTGALGRDLMGFVLRFIQANNVNNQCLKSLNTIKFPNLYTVKGMTKWFDWISDPDQNEVDKKFKTIKSCSELLAYQYVKLSKPICTENCSYLSKRILGSSDSIKYQLQRIYLHRNRIVHSGNLVNEYSNLWLHLEWYVGKLLAFAVIKTELISEPCSLQEAFRKLESDNLYLKSYFSKNSKKPISELPDRIKKILLEQTWQFY